MGQEDNKEITYQLVSQAKWTRLEDNYFSVLDLTSEKQEQN